MALELGIFLTALLRGSVEKLYPPVPYPPGWLFYTPDYDFQKWHGQDLGLFAV